VVLVGYGVDVLELDLEQPDFVQDLLLQLDRVLVAEDVSVQVEDFDHAVQQAILLFFPSPMHFELDDFFDVHSQRILPNDGLLLSIDFHRVNVINVMI